MFSKFSQRLAHLAGVKSPQRSGRHRKSCISVALSMGLIAAALATVSPARAQGDPLVEAQSGEWSCTRDLGDGTQQGILYQIVYNNGQNILYSYSEDESGAWSLDQEATFSLSSGQFFNALVMTPAGDMYAVLHGGNPEHQLVKFNAPATVGGVASYDVVANFPSESTSKAVNFSSYVEINGDPYLAMSNNGKNTNDELYNVTTGVFSDWNIVNAGNAKDAVWAPLGITSGGVTYPMVGIDENSANSVLYAVSGNTATLATTLTDLNGNSMSWDTSKAWGVGGSFGSANASEQSFYFFRNDGLLFEWEQTSDSTAALTQIGSSTPSNDNDGASCGNVGLEAKAIVMTTLAYDANGGSGAPDDQSGDASSDVTVSDTTPTREGYSFTGWNTAADGTGTSYAGNDSYTLPASGTDTLYAQWDPNTVTLAYDANGGSGAPNDQSGDSFSDVTVSDTTPTREGYSFKGWNTAADGTGVDYPADSTYTLPASGTDTLYAQWDPNTVTLAYSANGGSGAPDDQSGDAFSDVTVSDTTPTREGYSFTGWNTAADGTGTDYPADSTYTLPASGTDTLYAQWDPNTVTLAYDANGGSGAPNDQSGDAFSDVTVSDTTPTREGYSFTGWNTAADGTGVDYPADSTYTLPASGTDTLYAQWNQDVVGQATLAYSANGGSGAPGDQSGDASSDVTVSDTTPTREGYSFTGWNTAADGTGTSYAGNDSYTLPASGTDTLYAQWDPNTVTLAYDANGGSGAPNDQSGDSFSDVTVSDTTPTREGYSFTGWNTAADGSGVDYPADSTYTLPASGTDTLYAQWDPNTVTLAYDANGGSGAPNDQSGDAFSDVTVSDTTPTREGYSFTGWNTAADGTGVD